MPNVGFGELFVLLLLGLIVFGPTKLPEIARNMGKALRAFQEETRKAARTLKDAVEESQPRTTAGVYDSADARPAPPSPATAAQPEAGGAPAIPPLSNPPSPPLVEDGSGAAPADLSDDARLLEDT